MMMTETFAGVSRFTASDLAASIPKCDRSYAPLPDHQSQLSRAAGNSYVDLIELDEALELYFADLLNDVSSDRVNCELRELVPGKTLISQLDADDMRSALKQLDLADSVAIEIYYQGDQLAGSSSDFGAALSRLADVILGIL